MNRGRLNVMCSVSLVFLLLARAHAQGPDLTVVNTESGAVRGVAKSREEWGHKLEGDSLRGPASW
jgi:hypothetical protein